MSLIEKLKSVRNNGSRRQAHIDLACECIKEVELLETQLKASQAIIKEAHDKLLNVNAVSWEETAWEVKELLKIREVKR